MRRRAVGPQRIEDGALCAVSAVASRNSPFQLLGHQGQLTDALEDFAQMMAGQLVHLAARQCGVVGKDKEAADLLESKSEIPAASDEAQGLDFGRGVVPIAAAYSRRPLQQSNPRSKNENAPRFLTPQGARDSKQRSCGKSPPVPRRCQAMSTQFLTVAQSSPDTDSPPPGQPAP